MCYISYIFYDCRGRIIPKKLNVRVEHVKHSNCRTDFLNRMKANEEAKSEAKKTGIRCADLKRQPVGPRPGHFVSTKGNKPQIVEPIPYVFIA